MRDAGMVTVCTLLNTAEPGAMPVNRLSPVFTDYFEERVVGYNRFYAAKGVNDRVDLLIRTNRHTEAHSGLYAVLSYSENNGQYRITQVQQMTDDDGLKCTDISLSRMDELYEVDAE